MQKNVCLSAGDISTLNVISVRIFFSDDRLVSSSGCLIASSCTMSLKVYVKSVFCSVTALFPNVPPHAAK